MKIIFSRKGFDTSNGGIPSPMFADGTLLSLPIPEGISSLPYKDIQFNGKNYAKIICELNPRGKPNTNAHLDPDLRYNARNRISNKNIWRGLFGQWGVAQAILQKCGIGKDDIFLFFGWFKETIEKNGSFCYKPNAPDVHAVWGYMQVESLIKRQKEYLDYANNNPDIKNHPHAQGFQANIYPNNCIYVARDKLSYNDKIHGYGVLRNKQNGNSIILTENQKTKTNWKLPRDVFANVKFCSHNKNNLFDSEGRWCWKTLGQEFVVDCTKEPNKKVEEWAKNLIDANYDNSDD
ncbi:MAG: hypothetical protein LBT29_03170 [Flavobacteriaceae bacterium]|jgi:hypothetical protein|nr:hypothetical protein [Flavobacteriaceae bacterium]